LRRKVSGLIRGGSAALLVGVVVTGCGSRSSIAPVQTTSAQNRSSAACLQLSGSIADEAWRFVHTYQPGFGVGSTSDVAYFGLRAVLGGFKQQHCATRVLGRTLARRLTRRQQRELFLHLPRAMSAYFRLAITESQGAHA
jgi:hypothetical protein